MMDFGVIVTITIARIAQKNALMKTRRSAYIFRASIRKKWEKRSRTMAKSNGTKVYIYSGIWRKQNWDEYINDRGFLHVEV